MRDRMSRILKKRLALPVWALLLGTLVVTSAVGGAASGDASLDRERADAAEARAATAEDAAERADLRAQQAQRDAETAESEARRKLEAEFAQKERQLSEREAAVSALDTELKKMVEARLAGTFGDGVHEVGVDIQPGKYKTEGGSSCYWEKTAADGDILDNDLPGGPATVTITANTATFKSTNCGTWTKTG